MSAVMPASQQRDAVAVPRARGLSLPFDLTLLLAALGLGSCSVLTLDKATADPSYYVQRQLIYLAIGTAVAIAVWRLDITRLIELRRLTYALLIGSILAVKLFGAEAKGARRAIELPGFSFQASELGKVLLVVSLSAFVAAGGRREGPLKATARTLALTLVPAVLVMLQPDLGTSLVFIVIGLATLFVGGAPWQHFAALGALGAIVIALAFAVLPAAGVQVLHGYQKDRLTAFLHPSDTTSKESYQQNQSQIAIGSGEKTGRGARATQTRFNFVPERHTDFVFAVVGERWGFAGAALVLSLYALLIWRGLRILLLSKNLYGALVAGGIVTMLLFQVFVNVGMTVAIMPITGIPLPLMSYGGSSLIATLLAVGLLQAIYAQGREATRATGRVLTF